MRMDWKGDEFLRRFSRVSDDAVESIAKDVGATATMLCPRSDEKTFARKKRKWPNSKHLQDTINARKSKFKNGGWIVIAGGKGARHVNQVELGSSKMKAKPFLRPALAKHRGRLVGKLRANFKGI